MDKLDKQLIKRGSSTILPQLLAKIDELVEKVNELESKHGSKEVVQGSTRGKQGNKPKDRTNV